MDKMRMESPDMTAQNVDRIAALFPNCVTEVLDEEHSTPEKKVYKRAINFELLKQMLSPDVVEGNERYEFTWVGKKAAIVEANQPIRKTLRPCKEESKDWDTTENLYIEGDNLEVLKLLQESYLGKVKMIYIDPPYNTGNDFIYADDFMHSQEQENQQMGMYDEDGDRLFKNTDTNGRFHSDWCSMIYSRLHLAKNLLTDDGVIFISIDDSEVKNLKNICDEVFGAANFVAQLIWQNKKGGGNDSTHIAIEHEYILTYAKNIALLGEFYESYSDDYIKRYKEEDNIGRFFWDTFKRKAGKQSPLTTADLDVGFRVLKLDDTNMKDVYYAPDDYDQGLLAGLESNIKDDRTDLDLLFGCLLDWGLPLSMPYSSEQIDGCTVHTYNDGDLIACFDENVPESVVEKIAKRQPLRVVFRDSGFANSPAKINVTEIFKLLAPDTRVKVI